MDHFKKAIKEHIQFLYIDLFCGAGGTSTGVEEAMSLPTCCSLDKDIQFIESRRKRDGIKCAKVIACVNHDKNAIISHASNHPDTLHFTEDIRILVLDKLVAHVHNEQKKYPEAKIVLWASLECTNFSKAKGGMPRDPDSRTLAEHLFRYIEALKPDYIQIENVEEFMSWGDLDKKGKPISKTNGKNYEKWIQSVKSHGYDYDFRILNSADYGAYTSRKRYFGVFAKHDLPIVFPEPTHSKDGSSGLFDSLLKWRPVKDCLDFEDDGASIFDRKKPLVDATLLRIYAGLIKFVAGGKDKWILKYNSMSKTKKHNPPSINEPCPTISCQGRLGIVQTSFISKYFSGDPYSKNSSIEEPAGTITTIDHHSIVNAKFMQSYYGNGTASDINNPAPTVTTTPKHKLVSCRDIDNRHFLMNPQYKSAGGSIDNPCFTLIARMDKMPPYLINASDNVNELPSFIKFKDGVFIYEIYNDDSEALKEIKEFMAIYGILDIKMRMLRIPELKMIMGFPKDYILVGTQAEQKKYIGNAVEVNMARSMCEALADKFLEIKRQAA